MELTVYNCLAQFMMTFSASLLAGMPGRLMAEHQLPERKQVHNCLPRGHVSRGLCSSNLNAF